MRFTLLKMFANNFIIQLCVHAINSDDILTLSRVIFIVLALIFPSLRLFFHILFQNMFFSVSLQASGPINLT